jgi:hypothetical protein
MFSTMVRAGSRGRVMVPRSGCSTVRDATLARASSLCRLAATASAKTPPSTMAASLARSVSRWARARAARLARSRRSAASFAAWSPPAAAKKCGPQKAAAADRGSGNGVRATAGSRPGMGPQNTSRGRPAGAAAAWTGMATKKPSGRPSLIASYSDAASPGGTAATARRSPGLIWGWSRQTSGSRSTRSRSGQSGSAPKSAGRASARLNPALASTTRNRLAMSAGDGFSLA